MPGTVTRVKGGTVTTRAGVYPVTSITLHAAHNGIPSVEVGLDPTHPGSGSSSTTAPAEIVNKLTGVGATYAALRQAAASEGTREASLSVTLSVDSGGGAQEDVFSLDGWLLTGVGQVTDLDGALQLIATLSHPARRLQENTAALLGAANYMSKVEDYVSLDGAANLLDGAVAALELRLDQVQNAQFDNLDVLKDKVRNLVSALRDTLEWEGPGWPVKVVPGAENALKRQMYREVVMLSASTAWNFVTSTLINQWGASIDGYFWRSKLPIRPYTPWRGASYTLKTSDIRRIQHPGIDPMPVSGVCIIGASGIGTMDTTSINYNQEQASTALTGGACHIEPTLPGTVILMNKPGWVSSTVRKRNNGPSGSDTSSAELTQTEPGGASGEDVMQSEYEAGKVLSKYFFTTLHRRNITITLNCRLLLTEELAPGMQCIVNEDGGNILKFMVTSVTHEMDCLSGRAGTIVKGGYVRAPGEPEGLDAISDGATPNYMYE